MLKGIPGVLSPDLLKILCEMGHGDELVLADANFPSEALAQRCVRLDGVKMPQLLGAILSVFPLDTYVMEPAALMRVVEGDPQPDIWDTYRRLLDPCLAKGQEIGQIERFTFYERAAQAFAVVHTGETALYANVILKKGVVKE